MARNSKSDRFKERLKLNLKNSEHVKSIFLFETGTIIALGTKLWMSNPSDLTYLLVALGIAMIVSGTVSLTSYKLTNDGSASTDLGILNEFATIFNTVDTNLLKNKGLVKVHESRTSALDSFEKELDQIKDQTEVNVMLSGIVLGDFLLQYSRFNSHFLEWLENLDINFYMIILDKNSEAAQERARREEPEKFHSSEYSPEYDLDHIFKGLQFTTAESTATESGYKSTNVFHELNSCESSAKWLQRRYPDKIKIKKSSVFPVCYLAAVNDTLFVESYNCARKGGGAPVLEIKRDRGDDTKSYLYNNYIRHFISLWIKPCQGEKRENMDELSNVMNNFTLKDLPKYLKFESSLLLESCEEYKLVKEQIPTENSTIIE